jgi:RNA polymerase sigma-70 factor (ECF subfamily)
MTRTTDSADPASLVAHTEGLRALARSLVGDAHLAEDVVQDALLAAVRRPPAPGVPLGPWLVGAVRNLARFAMRSRSRRAVRDRAVGTHADVEAPDAVVARAEVHRRLVDALLAMPEPYRATLLLRYFEGREPVEIAAATGVPAATVRTRVHRGLAMLRDVLRSDDDAWRLALLPLVGPGVAVASRAKLATEVLVMTTKTKILAAIVVVALAAVVVSRHATTDTSASTSHATAPNAPALAERADRRLHADARAASAPTTDTVAKVPGAAGPADVAAERAKWPVRTTTNVPGSSVTLYVRYFGGDADPPPTTKTADVTGFAGFPLPERTDPISACSVVAQADGFATARKQFGVGDVHVDLVRGIVVRGHVVDASGSAVASASIMCEGKGGVLSEPDGSFEVIADKPGAVALHVEHPAFLPRDVAITAPNPDARIALERGLSISGRVSFPDLRPVPGVALADSRGMMRARTDEDGRYVVSGLAPGPFHLMCTLTIESRTFEAGATDADIVITKPVARIRLVDESQRPFRIADLWMSVWLDGREIGRSSVNGGASGVEVVQVESGARLLVTPTAPGFDQTVTTETFDGPPRLHEVRVVMTRSGPKGAIRVRVRDESDKAPPAVFLTVHNAAGYPYGGWSERHPDLDEHGRIQVSDVVAGRYEVFAAGGPAYSADGYWLSAKASIQVDGERTTDVELTMTLGGRIRATVKDASGAVVAPTRVELRSMAGARLDVAFVQFTDGGLSTEFGAAPVVLDRALAPGRYVVAATGPDGDVVKSDVDVARGATTGVELTVRGKR